ncbi:hypothetical protein [Acidicapsa ligni]|uniref:hypothetical protein n=1 Tax=Acidicapsa ligni TaxID=542300 RepID=UPI0021E09D3C|nr:hypothetical protein [Acidicapsa ligni]
MDNFAETTFSTTHAHQEAHASGVSWSAVFAGAFAIASLALILLALGSGLGLSSVSLWSNEGVSSSTIGTATILWLIFAELASSAMGGYLAGRLRTKWSTVHSDEVYFRDTVHGFIAWSVALVVTAAFLGAAATSLTGASLSSGPVPRPNVSEGPNAYFVDALFRGDTGKDDALTASKRGEVSVIFANALKLGSMPANDQSYLDQLVSRDTGLSASDADKRVIATLTDAQQTSEKARKAIAHTLLWAFIALLIGAFSASFAATLGGRQRDHVITTL